MNATTFVSTLVLGALLVASPVAAASEAGGHATREVNAWPALVGRRDDAAKATGWQAAGPLFFDTHFDDGAEVKGFRPFWFNRSDAVGGETGVLYPLFVYRYGRDRWRWSVLNLFNRTSPTRPGEQDEPKGFDVWPVYFSRNTGSPATSYHAVFPIYGDVKDRFLNDRVEWVLFPLYGRFQKGRKVVVTAPWPFVRIIRGGDHHGWALWPLAGRRVDGPARSQYYLWPLFYKDEYNLDSPTPTVNEGFLPFYASQRGPGLRSESYLWPFFGYLDRSGPKAYHETRYFWPFLVQGRGVQRYRNRWAPFYTHSVISGMDKTWVLWPLWKQQKWTESGLDQTRTEVLFFLYWSLRQQRAGSPEGARAAEKTHLWPLFSAWDNGAGRRQFELLSPLEPLFRYNREIRTEYSPLFAVYRFDQRAPGVVRYSFLWDAVSFQRNAPARTSEFHLGPLIEASRSHGARRYALLEGLVSLSKTPGAGWRLRFADFGGKLNPGSSKP